MSEWQEGGLKLQFKTDTVVFKHDGKSGINQAQGNIPVDGNSVWPGVDFRIENGGYWIWLETKEWPARSENDLADITHEAFALKMRAKFLGTIAYLAWIDKFDHKPVRLVFLFERNSGADLALRVAFQDNMKRMLKFPKGFDCKIIVMNVTQWNSHDYFKDIAVISKVQP
jgi:hypothetical protein